MCFFIEFLRVHYREDLSHQESRTHLANWYLKWHFCEEDLYKGLDPMVNSQPATRVNLAFGICDGVISIMNLKPIHVHIHCMNRCKSTLYCANLACIQTPLSSNKMCHVISFTYNYSNVHENPRFAES